jgi:signal peptidase I
VAVRGHSMAPRLLEGDWLLVDPDAFTTSPPDPGDLVLANGADGLVVKRLGAVLSNGMLGLAGDAPSNDDHGHELAVPLSAISGRPWFRYWPPHRIGRVR